MYVYIVYKSRFALLLIFVSHLTIIKIPFLKFLFFLFVIIQAHFSMFKKSNHPAYLIDYCVSYDFLLEYIKESK